VARPADLDRLAGRTLRAVVAGFVPEVAWDRAA
jgi:hypothetical protein